MDPDAAPAAARTTPRLLTGHAPRRRLDGGIQLGAGADLGLVLDGLTHADVDVLGRIDGRSTREDLTAHPTRAGLTSARAEQLLDLLGAAGLVTEPVPATRLRDRSVLVDGAGPPARLLADHLSAIGVGQVTTGPYAVDAAETIAPRSHRPDLVVVVAADPVAPARVRPLRARGIRHLVVSVAESVAVVGPLVAPGLGACLECLEAQRTDRDPGWPVPLQSPTIGPPEPVTCDPALAVLVAALAAALAVADLRGQCPTGVTLEVGLPWPRVVQRQWAPHPRCSCGVARAAAEAHGGQWTA
ncbi:MAG: hypothetical protein ABI131_11775 [Nostocoides sp.]